MKKLKIKKSKEKKLIGIKLRHYIDFVILLCCGAIAFNINPSNNEKNNNTYSNKQIMTYVFHDYAGNEYIMNDKIHGAPNSRDYLFDNEIPDDLRGEDPKFTDSVSLGDSSGYTDENDTNGTKDNQISFNDIINDLGIENEDPDSDKLIITIGDPNETENENNNYIIKEQLQSGNTISLIIEMIDNDNINDKASNEIEYNNTIDSEENINDKNHELLSAKVFSFTKEGRILPILVSRTDLYFNNSSIDLNGNNPTSSNDESTIIPNYGECMTPWGYKIHHGESVLAYKQMDNAPDICNIERRFCRKGKLSGTYTQQGCSINKNYTYEEWESSKITDNSDDFKGNIRQNSDGSVTVKNSEIGHSYVSDAPNKTYSDYSKTYNIREEEPGIEQTSRPHPSCTTPWGEKVKHGDFIQAFKHENGFSDAPCEAQIRLCSLGELMGTYTESTCKTRDSSFIDRVNGSPSWQTYSKEKIERIKKQIKNEKDDYENTRKNAKKSTNSDALDRILYILDQD